MALKYKEFVNELNHLLSIQTWQGYEFGYTAVRPACSTTDLSAVPVPIRLGTFEWDLSNDDGA